MDVQKNINFIKRNNEVENKFDSLLELLDVDISILLKKLPLDVKCKIEEIRLRLGKPLMVSFDGTDYFITKNSSITEVFKNCYIVTSENIYNTFNLISNYSIYAFEEELKKGFITIKGGHRVGIAGKAVYGPRGIETIKDVSSFNIRVAKEIIGVGARVFKYIYKPPNSIYHTLIVSPPQCGKTTLLRDLIRIISNGFPEYGFKGIKVGVVDERSEISSSYCGYPQNDVGIRTDVLDGYKKYDGIVQLIRSMSPVVVATDELGDSNDIKAIHEALKAGVKIVATVHGENINDLVTKPNMKEIIEEKIFERIIILNNSNGVGTIGEVLEGKTFKSILNEKGSNDVTIKNISKLNGNYIL